ncbi:MAG TPA: family 20 glycosylhydrolase [Candidatus Acidoferrum sp.]|nr:family 20 glycosylhydrolase [Candidatus Acidoferrum sp.]
MRFIAMLFSLLFLVLAVRAGAEPPALRLMPQPASVVPGAGSLRIDANFSIAFTGHSEARLRRAADRFLTGLREQTGFPRLDEAKGNSRATLVVHTDRASKEIQELGEDESYTLEVTSSGAKLEAANPLGVLRGLQTFLQLVEISPDGFAAPAVTIKDQPRFAWRGLLVDVGRHFVPLEVLKRNLDGMEAVKMNVLHLHLSDNQGFRVESRKFPKLQELGSDGMYYTQDQLRELAAYARDRGIRILPEFDMPGHSTSFFVGYPELASGPGPYALDRKWGVLDPAMNPTEEKTYKFLDDFIGEMARLFPDQYFHIGGDEVNGKEWDANPQIQEYKKAHNLKSNEELQAYFSQRVQKIVSKHGKTTVGWDEIFVPGVPKDIMIHSWRGPKSLAAAAQQGYPGILSNGYYLDLGWTAARHYAVDPLGGDAAGLSDEQKKLIFGGESAMWSEYVGAENIDSRIWPRNAAIAERLWSPESVRDPASMYERLAAESARLERVGLTHRSYYRGMLERIAGAPSPEEFAALKTLADVVEPVKEYTREETAPVEATSLTPLNRIVDAVSLESDTARHFSELVDKFLAGSCNDAALAAELRAFLARWSQNDPAFASLAQKSSLAREGAATSRDLSAVGAAGLLALEAIARSKPLSAEQLAQLATTLGEAAKPKAQLLLVPAAPVGKLVAAAREPAGCQAK